MASTTPPIPGEPVKPKAAGIPIGFGSLMRAVRRYSLLMFVFILLGVSAGALVYFFLPLPKMTGQMVFFVHQDPQYQITPGLFRERDSSTYRSYVINIFRNRVLLNAVLSEPGIAGLSIFEQDKLQEPIEVLRNIMKIDFKMGSEYLAVAIEGNEQAELLALLNAIRTSFMKRVHTDELSSRNAKFELMNKLKTDYQDKLKAQRASIASALSSFNGTDPETMLIRERFANSQIGFIDSELMRLNNKERELLFSKNRLEGEMKLPLQLREKLPAELIDQIVNSLPPIQEQERKINEINAKLMQYEKVAKGDNKPQPMIDLEFQRSNVEAALRKLKDDARPAVDKKLREEYARGEATALSNINSSLDMIADQKKAVMDDLKKSIEVLNTIKSDNARVEDMRIEVKNYEDIWTKLNGELVAMMPELGAAKRVEVWEQPYTYYGTEGNRRVKYTAIAVVSFLVLGLVIAQWLEIKHRRIQTLDEITNGLGLQVLGTVPAMPRGGVPAGSNWPHLLTEAVNTTRTMLLAGPSASVNKTLLVTSAMSGEGKTSLTTHLAVSLANAGRRVMLIDADMRRPAVHRVLGLTSKPGLAELLIGSHQLADVVQTCKIPNLHLVPAGTWSREAAASLSSDSWPRILQEASLGFDFVLVDSPPILPVADALAIARNVDGVLISIMQDQSRYGAVQTACQRLNMVGAKVLGVVVSGMKSVGGYYYYYYYDDRYSRPNNNPTPSGPEPNPQDAPPAEQESESPKSAS
jgi:polysaccharide biosynthesis transport protein